MNTSRQLILVTLLALLLVSASSIAQDETQPERGFVEFGFRGITGDVDGRTHPGEVPFSNGFRPDILNASVNTYRDYRNGFYIPRSRLFVDHLLGTKSYFSLQTTSNGIAFEGNTLNRDQSILATVGHYGLYKIQFRWDQTPHIFSGTTRTLYTETSPGVWTFTGNRAALQTAGAGTITALANAVNGQVANAWLDVQDNIRRGGAGLLSWDVSPDFNFGFSFARENQLGSRPHGMCFGNNPSCFAAEIPESIDYFTNTIRATTDFGQKNWAAQFGYVGQFFDNNTPQMIVQNPFSNFTNNTTLSNDGDMSLYPNNKAQNLLFGGAVNFGPHVHFMSSISPGWMSQNDPFAAYTTNTTLLNQKGAAKPLPLPASSLNGERQTLAMNYSFVINPLKNLEFVARYRHYDLDNNTPEYLFNPWVNDIWAEAGLRGPSGQIVKTIIGLNGATDPECPGVCNEVLSFHTKDLEFGGTWFFFKKNSVKVQYGRQWFDRTHRDVSQTIEDIFKFAVDLKPVHDFTLRISAAHQNREPQDAEYEFFLLPGTQRPDEGFRIRNRVDVLAQYDLTDRLSISGFFGTSQDDFNRRDPLTSLTPLGDPSLVKTLGPAPTPIYGPYFAYGLLKDISWNLGGDVDYVVSKNVTVFAEYAHERYADRVMSRQRSKAVTAQVGCAPGNTAPEDCDPINDWTSVSKDIVNTYLAGADLSFRKKVNVSVYYSLAASKGNLWTNGVNCQISSGPSSYCRTNFPNWRLDTATNPAVTFNFPETFTRLHEVAAIARFRAAHNLFPRFEYRYQQFDNNDFQTSVMNPYSFVGPVVDPVGTTGLQRWIFLGADNAGYKAHIFSATLEYHF